MKDLNKKQKIILITIISILLGAIIYYVYGKETPSINQNEIMPYENETNETEEENTILTKIQKEGVYVLEEGSRISDAIEQAEGLKEEADTSNINLAYKLEDGMKIKIPTQKENKNTNIENNQETFITQNSGLETEQIQTNSQINEKKQEKININKANQEELETLSGIGPSIANKIIQYRKDNGNFKSIDDIKNVSGIGENKYNEIKNSITIK